MRYFDGGAGLATLFAICLVSGSASADFPDSIRSPIDAFHQVNFRQMLPVLTPDATRWLLNHAGLDWPMGPQSYPEPCDWVGAVPSAAYVYCVLSGAKACSKGSEGFPYGDAQYGLLDSTGTVLWTKGGYRFCQLPAVSDDGVTAVLSFDGESERYGMPPLRVDFIGRDGTELGWARWDDRIWGSCVMSCGDTYDFSVTSAGFCIALNQRKRGARRDSRPEEDNFTVYSVGYDGRTQWTYEVGSRRVERLLFSAGGNLAYLAKRELHFLGAPPQPSRIGILDGTGSVLAVHDLPRVDEAVVENGSDSLFSYSPKVGLFAIDLRTGALSPGVPVERLNAIVSANDERAAEHARRILESYRYFEALPDSLRR